MKKTLLILGVVSALALTGCASSGASSSTTATPLKDTSGFLPDYSLLKEVTPSPKGMKLYTYVAPGVKRGDYRAVIVNPVMLYQSTASDAAKTADVAAAQASLDAGIRMVVKQHMPITTIRGSGVAVLSIAITGATVESEGFKPRNLLPVSAAIKLASMATGTNGKTPSMVVELKFTDSLSGKLLRETVSQISGDKFHTATTSEALQQLAQQWVQQALAYSNGQKSE